MGAFLMYVTPIDTLSAAPLWLPKTSMRIEQAVRLLLVPSCHAVTGRV
ncbi:MAG: hypothetical protein ACSLEM_04400 [Candidatus Malihini olakiniferum]